jgi:hypothetical protein
MFKKLLLAATLASPLALLSCDGGGGGMTVPSKTLQPGGVFVAFVLGCEEGCGDINRGDLIQKVDGEAVKTTKELLSHKLTDGTPHTLSVYKGGSKTVEEIKILSKGNSSIPSIESAPPFWTVGAADLDKAPKAGSWARRRLFGHAMPQLRLMNSDGGDINGQDFYNKPHIFISFDWAAQSERLHGATFLKVLQKAQADLKNAGFSTIFAQVQFPSQRSRPPMNDTDLRKFFKDNAVGKSEGGPLPAPPLYRGPNSTESNPAANIGLEGSFTVFEALGNPPAIVITDQNAIVRWHSGGVTQDPEGKLPDDVYTINAAVLFALEQLSPEF